MRRKGWMRVLVPPAALRVEWDETGIRAVRWEPGRGDEAALPWTFADLQEATKRDPLARFLGEWFKAYRSGRLNREWRIRILRPYLSPEIPRTRFMDSVWREVMDIPPGTTRGYGEVAARVGSPRAARAVGRAMARNPWPVLVPCHRVVRADGSPGGYSPAPAVKIWLLEWERSVYPAGA